MPTLLSSTSTRPKVLRHAATIASTSPALAASAVKAAALPPSAAMILTVSSAAAPLRSTQNTCAPSRAKVTAVALPLPQPGPIEPAPTTIAVLPLSRCIDFSPFHDSIIVHTRMVVTLADRMLKSAGPKAGGRRYAGRPLSRGQRGYCASHWQPDISPRTLELAKPAHQRPVLSGRTLQCLLLVQSDYAWEYPWERRSCCAAPASIPLTQSRS